MAPSNKSAVAYGFAALTGSCLSPQLLGAATKTQAPQRGLAAAAFLPAFVATTVLTPLLVYAHVRELGRAKGGARSRLLAILAMATFLAATVTLLADAVVQLGADGHLDRGRDDVARLNIK